MERTEIYTADITYHQPQRKNIIYLLYISAYFSDRITKDAPSTYEDI
jgi:hypothetical protein